MTYPLLTLQTTSITAYRTKNHLNALFFVRVGFKVAKIPELKQGVVVNAVTEIRAAGSRDETFQQFEVTPATPVLGAYISDLHLSLIHI